MREDLSKVEVLGDPNYLPRKAVEKIRPAWHWLSMPVESWEPA